MDHPYISFHKNRCYLLVLRRPRSTSCMVDYSRKVIFDTQYRGASTIANKSRSSHVNTFDLVHVHYWYIKARNAINFCPCSCLPYNANHAVMTGKENQKRLRFGDVASASVSESTIVSSSPSSSFRLRLRPFIFLV